MGQLHKLICLIEDYWYMLTNNVSMIIIIPKYFFLSNQEANDPLHNYLILVYFYSPLISVSQTMLQLINVCVTAPASE